MSMPLTALTLASLFAGPAQAEPTPPGELLQRIENLRTVGSVLYLAAHPDDENTRLIAYLVGERGLDVTYLSLTRGGGGQNLVGTEQAELLGVLRTDELLAARAIDGGRQRFSRARDFGYSKSAEEALAVWGHAAVLEDVVRVIREVRPDTIITRFGAEDRSHGHHVASAILAGEALEKAADPTYLPELPAWRVDRLVRNEASWNMDASTDTSGWSTLDVGAYAPLLGRSWGEIAADARTMHKSQGFGSAPSRGPQLEYFSATAGDVPSPDQDLFAGLSLGWDRFEGGKGVERWLAKAAKGFDPRRPEASVRPLLRAREALGELVDCEQGPTCDDPRLLGARADLERLILDCAGLVAQARASEPAALPGSTLSAEVTVLLRNPVALRVRGVGADPTANLDEALPVHAPWIRTALLELEDEVTVAPWLREDPSPSLYASAGDRTPEPVVWLTLDHPDAHEPLLVPLPVTYAWTDPVLGERTHPVELLPPVTATFPARTRLLPVGDTAVLPLTLRASVGGAKGVLHLSAPEGSTVTPSSVAFDLSPDAPEKVVPVEVTAGQTRGALLAEVEVDGRRWAYDRTVIDQPHLPRRTVLRRAAVDLVPVRLERGATERIGYLPGSGDAVPEILRDLGYTVDRIDEATVRSGGLSAYDTVVLGIRAFNTHPGLLDNRAELYDWVAAGGRLIVQYNTSNRWRDLGDVGPAPLEIDRDRVTDENAPLVPVDADDPVLTGPNRLEPADYTGWVQERGLYFGARFDPSYRAIFRTHDAGEEPLEGSLLVLDHGEGTFVYTGLSFFRQLPAGVPGAARLFANLLAVEPLDE